MAAQRRRVEAERERDLAIEEAAVAYHEVDRLRREVEQLRQEKEAWEAGQNAWSQRHEQILWHVGAMAETLWCAFQQQPSENQSPMSVEDAKLLALESFAQLTPKSDAQLYEEMHELYAKIAHMEAQSTSMAEKIRQLKRTNEELMQTQRRRAETPVREGIHANTPALCETKGDQEPVEVHPLPAGMSRQGAVDEFQEISPGDPAVVELLQAQLAMYISYAKRHNTRDRSGTNVDDRIEEPFG